MSRGQVFLGYFVWGTKLEGYGSREGQFPRWRFAVRVRSEGSAVKAPQRRLRSENLRSENLRTENLRTENLRTENFNSK